MIPEAYEAGQSGTHHLLADAPSVQPPTAPRSRRLPDPSHRSRRRAARIRTTTMVWDALSRPVSETGPWGDGLAV